MKLSNAQAKTLRTIGQAGGEMDGWAGTPGLNLNSLPPLVRMGLLERLESTRTEGGSFATYNRHRITEAGWEWLKAN